jgi:response regulator of citrate/malate metabolism
LPYPTSEAKEEETEIKPLIDLACPRSGSASTSRAINRKKIKGKIVVVTNIETNVSTEYISISEAASALNITRTTLRTYITNKTVLNILKKNSSFAGQLQGNGIIKEQFIITIKEK